ncbi:TadE/TadG family type IV pilus assembly protein [Phenylobacterium sp.]|uniref:TadE/TadG family type IV pilus assembly protein n=1 Tax=Phenylobacterium sp. TaxID=1871053 RepID=UPI0035B3B339
MLRRFGQIAWIRGLRDERGASAAEFVLVLPLLVMLTLGVINAGLMLYTMATLHFAVEDAARCATVKVDCGGGDPDLVAAYAAAVYKGPTITPTFTLSRPGCGNKVTGTANYVFTTGLVSRTVPISAEACYPLK